MSDTGVPLRILFELLFAVITAEIVFLVLVHSGELCIILINNCQTYGIGCHNHNLVVLQRFAPYRFIPFPFLPAGHTRLVPVSRQNTKTVRLWTPALLPDWYHNAQ
jgi:hypothetical protein